MQVKNVSDFALNDQTCKSETGKTLAEWFAELDGLDALKMGRRETTNHIHSETKSPWWSTTIAVEYERAKEVKKKDGLYEGYTICVTKTIGAPVSKTYKTWVDSKSFAEMFGDGGTQEVKEGGKIRCSGRCEAEFTRVRPDKDLRLTWRHPGCTAPIQIDVQFQDNKGKTLMNVMPSRVQSRAEADGLRNAWTEAMAKLKVLAET